MKIRIRTKITKVGNALYLNIPKIIHDSYKIKKGLEVELELSGDSIKMEFKQ
mgnify:CR=1 FL=1